VSARDVAPSHHEPLRPHPHPRAIRELVARPRGHRPEAKAPPPTHAARRCRARPEKESPIRYPSIHQQEGYPWGKDAEIRGSLANAEKNAASCISLPMFPELTAEEVDTVIDAVRSWKK